MAANDTLSLSRRDLMAGAASLTLGALAAPAHAESPGVTALWEKFCDALRPLAAHLGRPIGASDPLTDLEGVRCLSRLVALGLDQVLEYADPKHPAFFELQTATRKYLGDNPDQTYRTAVIDGASEYRVRTSTAGAVAFEVGVYAGSFRSDAKSGSGGRRLVASLDERRVAPGADGILEFTLGPGSRPGNHLQTAPDANSLLVRTYFHDRAVRSAHALPTIERLGPAEPLAPLSAEALTRGLLGAVAFVDGSLAFWNRFEGIRTAPNTLVVMPDDGAVQTPRAVRYLNGIVAPKDDEALLVELSPKDEPSYWNVVLQNLWGETLDWRYLPVVRNNRELVHDPDGKVRIAISHRPTNAVPSQNWMSMAGHRSLLLSLRWRGESALPLATPRLVPLD